MAPRKSLGWAGVGLDALEPASGHVKLLSTAGVQIDFLVPPEDQDRSGGVGGWEASGRPLRRPAHHWAGLADDDACTLPLLLDVGGQPGAFPIERKLDMLYAMGRPAADDDQPPGVLLLGDVPARDKRITWKLDGISLGAKRMRPDNVRLMYSLRLSVSLSRLTVQEGVENVSVRSTRNKQNRRRQRTIRTRKGETLRGIAVREMGSASEWKSIRANNKRLAKVDPDVPLRANIKVVLR